MALALTKSFKVSSYLATSGRGRVIVRYAAKQNIFSQGEEAASVVYLQTGLAKLTVVSQKGKLATVTLLAKGDFLGEEAMGEKGMLRTATATAITPCVALRISRDEMIRVMHEESTFSDFFVSFIVRRGVRTQADLVDQLFNCAERRLARTLLLMADYGKPGEPLALIPKVTQETLAEMIGATRSHVSFFMNRFRSLGYIEYDGRIRVNKLLLNMLLRDSLPEQNASGSPLLDPPPSKARTTGRSLMGKR